MRSELTRRDIIRRVRSADAAPADRSAAIGVAIIQVVALVALVALVVIALR